MNGDKLHCSAKSYHPYQVAEHHSYKRMFVIGNNIEISCRVDERCFHTYQGSQRIPGKYNSDHYSIITSLSKRGLWSLSVSVISNFSIFMRNQESRFIESSNIFPIVRDLILVLKGPQESRFSLFIVIA